VLKQDQPRGQTRALWMGKIRDPLLGESHALSYGVGHTWGFPQRKGTSKQLEFSVCGPCAPTPIPVVFSLSDINIEYLGGKRPLRSPSPAINLTQPSLPLNHVPKCHTYT